MTAACTQCKGRGYTTRYSHRAGRHVPVTCGRCGGARVEPEYTLRELQQRNQQRIREERANDLPG